MHLFLLLLSCVRTNSPSSPPCFIPLQLYFVLTNPIFFSLVQNKMLNTGILSIGIISYYLFFKGESIQKAVKVSNILWAYEMTRNILSGDATAGGYSDLNMAKLTVAIFIFAAFAMTQDYADTVIKATSILWGATGAHCYFAPESAKSLWKLTEGPAERTSDNCQDFGIFLLSYSILTGSLVFCEDVTALKALAYATVPWLSTISDTSSMTNSTSMVWKKRLLLFGLCSILPLWEPFFSKRKDCFFH